MALERKHLVLVLTLGAGAMDTTTGLLLVALPATTVALFGAAMPPGDDILMRFVGAFVAGVGMSYLWALATRDATARANRLPGVWSVTALVRTVIALFVGGAVALGRLDAAWLVVALSDAFLATVQIAGLRAGWLQR
jgi:hypothetical protein